MEEVFSVKSIEYSDLKETYLKKIEGKTEGGFDMGIILPTYCEANNIRGLIQEIEELKLDSGILVIDDSSPDGTANIVREMQKKYSNILLFVRPKKCGLGTAITDGFKIFLSLKKPPKYVITMDADYSHNPKDIIKIIKDDAHLTIGSRYCKGGKTQNWSPLRRIISKIANRIASLVVGARIRDYTSGFRCYSTTLIRNILPHLHSQTYEIQIETIRQAHLRGFKIKERPITFVNRKKGKSKLTLNEIKGFAWYILKVKLWSNISQRF